MKQSNNTADKIIRMQYFNIILYYCAICAIWIPFMVIVISFMFGDIKWADVLETVWISLVLHGMLALPFGVLSILNRFLFGKNRLRALRGWYSIGRHDYKMEKYRKDRISNRISFTGNVFI